jgi:outer membrane receptor protein involved in Fe transport
LLLAPAGAALGDGDIVVTGTRLPGPAAGLPGARTSIGRDEIEARNDAGAVDLLAAVPGLHVNQPGAGGVVQLFVRGAEPNFTVFMLDGVEVNDPTNTRGGSFDLATLDLAAVERVEIVRGPQSSIYGSDALAGAVNVITRGGARVPTAEAGVEAGGEEYRRASLRLAGPLARDGGFSLQAAHRDDGEAVPGSTRESDSVSGALTLDPRAGLSLGLHGRYASGEQTSFPEQSGGPEYAVLRDLDRAEADDLSLGADADWRLAGAWSLQARATLYRRDGEYASPGIAPLDQVPPNGARNELDRRGGTLRLTWRPAEAVAATAGLDYQREEGDSTGYVEFAPGVRAPADFDMTRDTLGAFVETRLRPAEAITLAASLRHDEPDAADGEWTGKAGAAWSPGDGRTRLTANWGTGFKLPSFFALSSPLVGNPDLRPEQSRSLEVGVARDLAGGAAEIGLVLFDNDYEDLIDFDPATFRNVNRDEVAVRGVEVNGRRALSPMLGLRLHATWTDIEVRGSDRELLQRPDWRGGASLRWQPRGDWLLDLDWLYVGRVLDAAIPTGTRDLDAWHRLDLAASWKATPRLRLTLAVDNLLDASYEEAIGFPAAGIRPRLGASPDPGNGRGLRPSCSASFQSRFNNSSARSLPTASRSAGPPSALDWVTASPS